METAPTTATSVPGLAGGQDPWSSARRDALSRGARSTFRATEAPDRTGEVSPVEHHHVEPSSAPTPRTASRFSNSSRRTTSGPISYLQPDPLGFPNAGEPSRLPNLYAYVESSPLNLIDPSGLKSQICCRYIGAFGSGSNSQQFGLALAGITHCWLKVDSSWYSWMPLGCSTPENCDQVTGAGANQIWAAKRTNHPADATADFCSDCEGKDCKDPDSCIRKAYEDYPELGPYNFRGPNSNTFAGRIARQCCENARAPRGAWGWNQ